MLLSEEVYGSYGADAYAPLALQTLDRAARAPVQPDLSGGLGHGPGRTRLHALAAARASSEIDGVLWTKDVEAVTSVVALQLLQLDVGVHRYQF